MSVRKQASSEKSRALFLDRDGVINRDTGYVSKREDFIWQDGIFELTKLAHEIGYRPVIVTNQAGIGRGLYSEDDYNALATWMCEEFAARGTPIERVYHCPYHPEAKLAAFRADHPWRKPQPGMFLAARDELNIDMAASIMVGDQWRDAQAACAAGIKHIAIVGEPAGYCPENVTAVRFSDLIEVKDWLEKIARA